MLGLLVVTHGRLAEELVNATKTIVKDAKSIEGLSIGWDDEVGDATERIEKAIRRVDCGQGVLVLTDMFGGTPTNIALSLLEVDTIEIVTGVNLPMLIKFTNLEEETSLQDAAARLAEQGKNAIQVASQLLENSSEGPAGDDG